MIVIYRTDVNRGVEVEGETVYCVPSNNFFDKNIHLEQVCFVFARLVRERWVANRVLDVAHELHEAQIRQVKSDVEHQLAEHLHKIKEHEEKNERLHSDNIQMRNVT